MVRYRNPDLEGRALGKVMTHTNLKLHRVLVADNGEADANLGALWNTLIGRIETPFVCLLNTDTEVNAGWLDRLVETAERTGAEAVGPMTNKCGINYQVGSARYDPNVEPRRVRMLSGFCLLLRKSAWARHGGFREDLAHYGQESNLMDRFVHKVVDPAVFVRHDGRGSFPADRNWDEERGYGVEVYKRNRAFDWTKRLLVLGSGPGNPFPLWRGVDAAVGEFRRQGMCVEHLPFDSPPQRLEARVRDFAPDVTLVACTNFTRLVSLLPVVRRSTDNPVGLWYNDLRSNALGSRVRGSVDRLFMCWSRCHGPYDLDAWRRGFGCSVDYMPQGSVLNVRIRPIEPPVERGSVFIGGLYPGHPTSGYRRRLIEGVGARVINEVKRDKRIGVEQKTPEIYRQYRFCLSTSPQAPGYQSLRLYNILAYGGLALVDEFPGLGHLFRHGVHVLRFNHRDVADAKKVMEEFEDNTRCEIIRRAGWRLQQAKHTVGFRLLNMAHNLLTGKRDFWGWLMTS